MKCANHNWRLVSKTKLFQCIDCNKAWRTERFVQQCGHELAWVDKQSKCLTCGTKQKQMWKHSSTLIYDDVEHKVVKEDEQNE